MFSHGWSSDESAKTVRVDSRENLSKKLHLAGASKCEPNVQKRCRLTIRRHPQSSWKVSMTTAPEWLVINSKFRISMSEFEFAFVRSSGPGGQNVNKVSSKAQLRWRPEESPAIPEELRFRMLTKLGPKLTVEGDLLVISQRYRDQPRNKEDCLEKLKTIVVASLVVAPIRKKAKPSRAAKARRLKDKKIGSAKKEQRRSPSTDD